MEESNNRSYYAIIPANVRYDKDLPPNAKLLYGEITALCNEKGYCWATNNYFASLYSVGKRSITGWISTLEKKGFINLEFIRENGNKAYSRRLIRIQGGIEKNHTPGKNLLGGIEKICYTPIEKICQENNTPFNNTSDNTPLPPKGEGDASFDKFWAAYPKKVSKPQAMRSWKKIKPNAEALGTIMAAIEVAKESADWKKEGGKYIPYPATWLNNRRWEDVQETKNNFWGGVLNEKQG